MLAAGLAGLAGFAGFSGLRAGFRVVAAIVRSAGIHHRHHGSVFHRARHQGLREMRVPLQRDRDGKQQEEAEPESMHGLTVTCAGRSGKPGERPV